MHRGYATGIYTTNSPEACFYVLDSAKCQIVVVENDVQLQKILQIKDRLPELRSIIQYKGQPPEDCPEVLSVSVLSLFSLGFNMTTLIVYMNKIRTNSFCRISLLYGMNELIAGDRERCRMD